MKVTVLGCGAIGQLWLASLYKQGYDVQGWLRVARPYYVINLTELSGNHFMTSLPTNNVDFLAQSDLLLVTLKAWQVSDAVKMLVPILPDTSPVLLLHNGMGTSEELQTLQHPLVVGITTHAARYEGNTIVHTAQGTTHIGPGNEAAAHCSQLASLLHDALPGVTWYNDIARVRWFKLAANCVINPLTAVKNCKNGDLRQYPQEVMAICHEVIQIMLAEGLTCQPEILLRYVGDIIESTAENISSMLQDIRLQRHTEIDYITGYLLQRARQHGISLPLNQRLYELIKRKENKYEHTRISLPGSGKRRNGSHHDH